MANNDWYVQTADKCLRDSEPSVVNADPHEDCVHDLLHALRGALLWLEGVKRESRNVLEDGQPPHFGFNKIRAAIAKAEGRQ